MQQIKESIVIEGVEPITIDGVEVSAETVASTFYSRIWKSAQVCKNKRESDKGGVKAIIGQAIQEELIDKDEALMLLLTPDKARLAELKAQLPTVEKSEEPSSDDVALAVKQVQANQGQAS